MLNFPSVCVELALWLFTFEINLRVLLVKTPSLLQCLGRSASSALSDLQQHLVSFGLFSTHINIFCSSFEFHYIVYCGLYRIGIVIVCVRSLA